MHETEAIDTADTDTADIDMLILLGYICSILHALCSVLDQYIFHYCIMLKIMLLLNHVPLKLNKFNISSNTLKSFKI
jgi:hypothetical protein